MGSVMNLLKKENGGGGGGNGIGCHSELALSEVASEFLCRDGKVG